MTKIANHVFQSFCASYSLIKASVFRAYSKKERIIHDLAYLAWKKIEKDYAKSRIQNHQCKRFLAWISNLIQSHIYTHCNPNAQNRQAAPQTKKQLCIFSQNSENYFHRESSFQGLKSIPKACWDLFGRASILFQSPRTKKW